MPNINLNNHSIREAAILTGSYVAGTDLTPTNGKPAQANQLVIYAEFTIGSLTTADIKVEFSHNGTDWFQDTTTSISGSDTVGTLSNFQMGATGNYRFALPISDPYIRISAIGNGTATGSSLAITAILAST